MRILNEKRISKRIKEIEKQIKETDKLLNEARAYMRDFTFLRILKIYQYSNPKYKASVKCGMQAAINIISKDDNNNLDLSEQIKIAEDELKKYPQWMQEA